MMTTIKFDADGTAIWSDTGKPVKKTVNYCASHRLGIEHAKPSKAMDKTEWQYEQMIRFEDISKGMRIPPAELYILLGTLPATSDEMYMTDQVARVLKIPPGTLAGKCRVAKARSKK